MNPKPCKLTNFHVRPADRPRISTWAEFRSVATIVATLTFCSPALYAQGPTVVTGQNPGPNWAAASANTNDTAEGLTDNPRAPESRDKTAEDRAKEEAAAKKSEDTLPALVEGEGISAAGNAKQPEAPLENAPIVREIRIEGATGESEQKARVSLQTQIGEPLNPEKQRQDLQRLYDLGLFRPDIQIEADKVSKGVALRYIVRPNPTVDTITVQGNQKIPTERLLRQLPTKSGQVYSNQAQSKLRDAVTRYYTESGFSEAVATVEERPSGENSVNLVITVDEGTKMKIKDFIIEGNQNVSASTIRLRVNNRGSFGPLTNYYNESKFAQDIEAVKALYVSRGFLDVDVQRGDFLYAQDQSWVSPVVRINEGPRYRVGRVDARGYSVFSREEVMAPFEGLQGEYYDASRFDKSAERVRNIYGDEGFLLARVEPDFNKDPVRGVVDVDIAVTEGSRIYVGDVKILSQIYPDDMEMGWLRRYYSRFSPPVRDEVVEREIRLRPGQVYRRYDEVRTKERLKSLGVFEEVKVSDQYASDSNIRDVVVEVTQGNTGNLIFGAGFGEVEGVFVFGNYVERNLFGMARDLRISALIGSNANSLNVSYLDRYFMGSDIAAQFSLFRDQFRRTGDFTETRLGTTAEFTRPLSEYLKDSVRLRLENVSYDLDDSDKPQFELEDYVAATVRYKLARDTRDNTFFPRTGSLLSGSVETGVAKGFLAKFEGNYSGVYAMNQDWVLANNTMVGFIPNNFDNIGYGERFFLGGSTDLRGFRLSGAGDHDPSNNDIPLGGATKLLTQFEVRRSINDNLTGLAFADIGMLGGDAFEFQTPRASLGVGVRYRMPIASVGLDLAVPVITEDDDQTQFFHFSLTSAF